MHQTLQNKLAHGLTLTPKLQQAIRLLSLSSSELAAEIELRLESNPLLEIDDDANAEELALLADIPAEPTTETEWIEERSAAIDSLRDHLFWQINTGDFNPRERLIGEILIDNIDDRGYLVVSLENDVIAALHQLAPNTMFSLPEIEMVLGQIQRFDPSGIGARDLRECLLIQLNDLPPTTPGWRTARRLVTDHLKALGQLQISVLARKLDVTEETLEQAVALIHQLHPYPAGHLSDQPIDYIVPDLFARRVNQRWVVELNEALIPKLRINSYYAGLIEHGNKSPDMHYLRSHLQEAQWFLKNLRHRTDTLLSVGSLLVALQSEFLDHGATYMRPLILRDVADKLNVHESTVSRITTRKFLNTPRGIFELKYFFSSHIGGEDGEVYSAIAIQAQIQTLINGEENHNPLSDNMLCKSLNADGKSIARRTVTKYRKLLKIPSSNERRREC